MDQVREAATIADLAHAAVPVDESGGAWPTSGPIGLGLTTSWYLHASSERVRYWNINTVVETARPVDAGALEVAVRAVAAQHEATRHRFYRAAERWHAEVVDEARVEVRREFVGPLSPHEQELAVGRLMNDLQRSIDITNGPIAIVAIVDRGPGSTPVVALTASHLVSDGYSQSVLLEDLEIAYEQVLRGDEVSLPARPTSLRRWTERLQELAEDAETDRERAYWLSEERWQAAPVPLDHPGGGNRHGSATWLRVPMDRARTTALYASSRRRTAGVLTAFLAALGTAYAAWTGHDRMMYWLLLHGREQELHGLDLRRTVGCMLHSFPMLQRLPAGDRRARIGAVRAMRSGLPRNGIGSRGCSPGACRSTAASDRTRTPRD